MTAGILPTSKRAAVASAGACQTNFASFAAYHWFGSGCVGEEIRDANGAPETAEGVVDSGMVVAAPPKLNRAFPKLAKMLVPFPSFARAEPEEKLTRADPAAFGLKFIARIFPFAPANPGLSTIPSKLTVPTLLETDGSCPQRVKIEPVFESE